MAGADARKSELIPPVNKAALPPKVVPRNTRRVTPSLPEPSGVVFIGASLNRIAFAHQEKKRLNHKPDSLTIEISDSGIGIEPQFLDRIFDAFEQGGPGVKVWGSGLRSAKPSLRSTAARFAPRARAWARARNS